MQRWIDVTRADQLPPGEFAILDVNGVEVAVFNVDGTYYATEDLCTHDGGTLAGGCIEDAIIECPRHGARFSLVTGQALSAPAYEPIGTFPVRLAEGMIQISADLED
jgi:3-phenylpropionate/trans-cinnamate dioxygenase ferredoxin component